MKDLESLKDLIKEQVSLGKLLVRKGRIRGTLSEEQFSCMFHGADRKKSCRYYKETDTAYCWVCKEKWDVISFVQRLEGMSFMQAVNYLVSEHRIDTSRLPDAAEAQISKIRCREEVKIDQKKLKIERLSAAVNAVRDDIPMSSYARIVHAFMLIKYLVPDEKFEDGYASFRQAMLNVLNRNKTEK